MKTKFLSLFVLIILIGTQLLAQPNRYKFKREIVDIDSLWHSIVLPVDVFGKISPDFSDIRIFGISKTNDTLEAPFFLKINKGKFEQNEITFKLINQSKNEKGNYYTFEIPTENAINQIQLEFKDINFDWKLALDGSQNLNEWFSIVDDYRILSIKNNIIDYRFTKVEFPDSKYRYFRLLIKNAKNPQYEAAKLILNEKTEGKFDTFEIKQTKIDEDKKTKQTIVFIDLKTAVPVSKFNFFISAKYDYYRPVAIQYVYDSAKTEKGWYYNYNTLASGTLNSIEKNEFNFPTTILQKLKLTIENQDNNPLKIDSFLVQGFSHDLIARFNEPANYAMYYGNVKAMKPDYDIAHFEDKIPSTVTSVSVGDEQIIKQEMPNELQPLFQNKIWLWIIMAIIIALLGWFSLKMIGSK